MTNYIYPQVAVFILNYNGGAFVLNCLKSVLDLHYPGDRLRVLLIDNASTDGSVELVKRLDPDIQIIQNRNNLGICRAYNLAVEAVDAEIVAMISPDIEVEPRWLEKLVVPFGATDPPAATAGRIMAWDGGRIDSAGANVSFCGLAWPRVHPAKMNEDTILAPESGAMCIRRDTFLEVGGFDEDYFAYYEDIDLGMRLARAGHKTVLVSDAISYNRGQGAWGRVNLHEKIFLIEKNALLTIYKNYPDHHLVRILPAALMLCIKRASYAMGLGDLDSKKIGAKRSVSCAGLAHLAAIDFFYRLLKKASSKRALLQAKAVTPPKSLYGLFNGPFHYNHEFGAPYRNDFLKVASCFGIHHIFYGSSDGPSGFQLSSKRKWVDPISRALIKAVRKILRKSGIEQADLLNRDLVDDTISVKAGALPRLLALNKWIDQFLTDMGTGELNDIQSIPFHEYPVAPGKRVRINLDNSEASYDKVRHRQELDSAYTLSVRPLISILMPVYNTEPEILRSSIESVLGQSYTKWELCIVDDASTVEHVRSVLEEYQEADPRIRVSFSDINEGIAATGNKAAAMASGEYIGVLDHDDELDPTALFEYIREIDRHPDADCIYCDEDKIDEKGKFCEPWFKSDWNPDLALSFNYVMHFALYRRGLFERLGGFRKDFEGSQDYDLLLRVSEKTDSIYHIPKILYHWRMGGGSIASGPEAKPHVFANGLAALNESLKRRRIDGIAEDAPDAWKGVYRVKRGISTPALCSIIIVSSGNDILLSRLLKSIFSNIPKGNYEVLVLRHSSTGIDGSELSIRAAGDINWVKFDGANTIPRALNIGVYQASGDVVFFVDETMELMSFESYGCLREHIQRPEIGAVGGKVFYENGLVEHGGVILGPFSILGYAHRATPDGPGYVGLKNMICNYSAVMGLGMMTRKDLFMNVCGLDEELGRGYWDVDYCLKLRERGYLVTYTPYARLLHHIRIPGGHEMVVEPEAALFRSRWQHIIDRDPYFNPNFSRGLEDFSFGANEKIRETA
ncbi:MAG: glycosyltransferase [Thermodesulfobacteriota bacterium]|nr:glycosyltransferase [Thermodesulfobacteriota bacterium]